jgi:hypothetical protein
MWGVGRREGFPRASQQKPKVRRHTIGLGHWKQFLMVRSKIQRELIDKVDSCTQSYRV